MHDRLFNHSKAHKLEDPARRIWMPIDRVLEAMDLKPGTSVADIGAGTGYFAIPLAEKVAPDGKVFAVDVQQEMLDLLQNKLKAAGSPANIELRKGEANETTLSDGCVEIAFLANVWHEIDDLPSVLRELRRILTRSGRLTILDWRADVASPPGPPQEHRIPSADVVSLLSDHGWNPGSPIMIGEFSYLILGSRPTS